MISRVSSAMPIRFIMYFVILVSLSLIGFSRFLRENQSERPFRDRSDWFMLIQRIYSITVFL